MHRQSNQQNQCTRINCGNPIANGDAIKQEKKVLYAVSDKRALMKSKIIR